MEPKNKDGIPVFLIRRFPRVEDQVQAFGKKGDILIIISTSGNSKNILEVLKKSKNMGVFSIGFLGNKGGKAKKHCDLPLIVESDTTSVIQETHIFLGHYILENVEKKIIKR